MEGREAWRRTAGGRRGDGCWRSRWWWRGRGGWKARRWRAPVERAATEGRSDEGRWEGLRLGEVSNIVQIFVFFEYSFYSNIRFVQIF